MKKQIICAFTLWATCAPGALPADAPDEAIDQNPWIETDIQWVSPLSVTPAAYSLPGDQPLGLTRLHDLMVLALEDEKKQQEKKKYKFWKAVYHLLDNASGPTGTANNLSQLGWMIYNWRINH